MPYRMNVGALPRRRYVSPRYGLPAYGLLDVLDRPELVRASDVSQSGTSPQPADSAGISPFRWLAGQVGLLDLLGATDAAAQQPAPISAREPDEPSWFERTKERFHETFPPVPPPEMVRNDSGGVWRKDIYDLIEDISVAEREDEAVLRRRIQDVLADAPLTRDRWFHSELSNRLDGDDPETIRTALRDWGHEDSIRAREMLSQLIPGIALAGSQLLQARARQATLPQEIRHRKQRGGRLGSAETRSLNEHIAKSWKSELWKHTGGANKREEYIPSPLRDFGMDGRKGSNYLDTSFTGPEVITRVGPRNLMTRVQTTTTDKKTGKPMIEEVERMLKIFLRVGGNVIGVSKKPHRRNMKRD